MIACLSELIKHLALSPSLLSEGTSVYDNEFSYSLFYYFAKEFAFFSVETLKSYHATFSEVELILFIYHSLFIAGLSIFNHGYSHRKHQQITRPLFNVIISFTVVYCY